MNDAHINLIKKDVSGMNRFSRAEDLLRNVAVWYLGLLFVSGVVVGGLFFFLRMRIQEVQVRKTTLVQEINAQSVKEGILISLKDRIGIAGKALDAAKPWGKLFVIMDGISDAGSFSGISIDESGRVSVSLELPSVDDAVLVIANMMSLSIDRSLKTPQMLGFAFREDGRVQLSLSFFPIFSL